MSKLTNAAIPAVLALFTATSAHTIAGDDGPGIGTAGYTVLAPGSIVAGKSIAAWTADWWTWAWNSPAGASPLDDTNGALANQDNHRSVFFVAGSNVSGPVTRSFDVPAGRPLLIPMINNWENCPGDPAVTCGPNYLPDPKVNLAANVAVYRAAVKDIFAVIDGVPVSDPYSRWEVSDFFSGGIAQPGTSIVAFYESFGLTLAGLDIAPSLASGYWAMVTDLSPGAHTLSFGGSTTAFGPFEYQVTANINVMTVPEPQTLALWVLGLGLVVRSTRRRSRATANALD